MADRGTLALHAAEELIRLALRSGHIIRRFAEATLDQYKLTMPHYRALRALSRRARRMSDLADLLMLSKQTISQTVNSLVVEGLVTREEDTEDRRHTIVTITSAGVRRLEHFEAALAEYIAEALADVDERQRRAIGDALALINATFDRRREEGFFKRRSANSEHLGRRRP